MNEETTDKYLELLINIAKLCVSSSDKNKIIEDLENQVNSLINDEDKEELHKSLNELKLKYNEKNDEN